MSTKTQTSPATRPVFVVNEQNGLKAAFQEKLDKTPFLFAHSLSENPLFDMPNLQELAMRLPGKVHFNGKLAVDQGWKDPSAKKASFQETFNQLQDGKSWIILKRVQDDPEYAPFLSRCLAEAEALSQRSLEPIIESRTMSLILSSPGQVTPYHVDADCNFLFQIRGAKEFYVFDGRDRAILPETEEENFWAGDLGAAKFREEHQSKAWTFAMEPGNGVHVPVIYPHWVKNNDNVSVSLSINFRFAGQVRGNVHRANHFLRRIGLRPRPTGQSPFVDSLKAAAVVPPRAGIKLLRRLKSGKR